jgi:uroporphyrinogen decarboxylase
VNGKERILTALSVEEPDRVPLYIHAINEEPIIGIGKHLTTGLPEPRKFHELNDAEKGKLIDTLFLIHEEFGVDGITCFEIGHQAELDEKRVQDDWGVISHRNPHGIPVPKEHPIRDAAELERYRRPEPKPEHLLLLNLARERFKGETALFWMMRGIFVRSWHLVGMENLMIGMATDPEFVHRVAEMVLEYNLKQLDMLVEAGLDVLIVEDDVATTRAPMISLEYFKSFVNPYNRKLVERGHELGLKVIRHSDGNLWRLLDVLLETGYDGLNPLEPQADMGLKKVKEYCGDRICLLGNIDCQELLPRGTPEQVEAAVKQAIDDAAEGGGLIICSSNSLHPAVNPENCIAMFQATKKYGAYDKTE